MGIWPELVSNEGHVYAVFDEQIVALAFDDGEDTWVDDEDEESKEEGEEK